MSKGKEIRMMLTVSQHHFSLLSTAKNSRQSWNDAAICARSSVSDKILPVKNLICLHARRSPIRTRQVKKILLSMLSTVQSKGGKIQSLEKLLNFTMVLFLWPSILNEKDDWIFNRNILSGPSYEIAKLTTNNFSRNPWLAYT